MTVTSTESASGPYAPNGATVEFPFTFRAMAIDEVSVILLADDGDEETVDPNLYTVALAPGDDEGGTITFLAAPVNDGRALWVISSPDFDQNVLFEDEGAFNATILNQIADRAAVRSIWLQGVASRAITVPFDEAGFVLPKASTRAGKLLVFGPAGEMDVVDVAPSSLTTLAGLADEIDALAAIDTEIVGIYADITGDDTIGIVAANMAAVVVTAGSIGPVNTVAANLAGANTIGIVSASIGNVNLVGAAIANVNLVAANLGNIDICAVNIAAIIAAPANAALAVAARDIAISVVQAPKAVGRPIGTALISGAGNPSSTRCYKNPLPTLTTFTGLRVRTVENAAHTLKWRRFVAPNGAQVNDGLPGSIGHDVDIVIPAQGAGGGEVTIAFNATAYAGEYVGWYAAVNTFAQNGSTTGDEGGFYSAAGDVATLAGAALTTTTREELSFIGTYPAVSGQAFVDMQTTVAGLTPVTGEDTPASFSLNTGTAAITATTKNKFNVTFTGASSIRSVAGWIPAATGTYTMIYAGALVSGTAPTAGFYRTSAATNLATLSFTSRLNAFTFTGGQGTGGTDHFRMTSTVDTVINFDFFFLIPGDWRAQLAKVMTTPQQQLALLAALQAADDTAQIVSILLQTAKVPALEAQANAVPVLDVWEFDGMDIPADRIMSGVGPFTTAVNDHRSMLLYGDLSVYRMGPATNTSNIVRYIKAVDVTNWTDGELATMHMFCRTDKSGNSGSLLNLRYTDATGVAIGGDSSTAFVASGNNGTRRKMLTSSGVSTSLAKPAGAIWLLVIIKLNAPAVGNLSEFFSPSLVRGQNGAITPDNRLSSAFTAGPASILLKRTGTLYVSQDGLSTNLGDTFNRINTIDQAYAIAVAQGVKSLKIIAMRGGTNRIPSVGLGNTLAIADLEIQCEPGVVIDAGIRITGWTQTPGTVKVWQAAFTRDSAAADLNQIFIHGVPDVSRPVPLVGRNPLYGDATYRLPSTKVRKTVASTLAAAKVELDAYPTGTTRMFFDTAANIVYAITPNEDDPVNYEWVGPRRYWTSVSSSNYLHPGRVRLRGILEYSGLQGDGRRWEFDNFQALMGQASGFDPGCGFVHAKGVSMRGHGIDGWSPHAPLNGLSMQGRVEGFLFTDNEDEGLSDHYLGCAYTYVDGDSEFNQSGGYTPAYGAETKLIHCRSRSNQRNYSGVVPFLPGVEPDGGLVVLNDDDHSTVKTRCIAIGYISRDDWVGASTRVQAFDGTAELILENPLVIDPYGKAYSMEQPDDTTYNAAWVDGRAAAFGAITNKIVTVIG